MSARHTPGPWSVGYRALSIVARNVKVGGEAKLFDVRGWGYLTGGGHGALGLDDATAIEIQTANATLAAAAPDMLEALRLCVAANDGMEDYSLTPEAAEARWAARAAIARASTLPASAMEDGRG